MADNEVDQNSPLAKLFQGSTAADCMAKAGSRQSDYPRMNQLVPDDEVPLWPLSEIKRRLFNKIQLEWKFRWEHNCEGSPICIATKNFLPSPNNQFWKIFNSKEGNSRLLFSEVVFIVTDINYLPAFEHKINNEASKACFLCKEDDSEMDSFHILWLCPALGTLRLETFGPTKVVKGPEESQAVGGARFIYDLPANQLVRFLRGLRKHMSLLPSLEVEV